MSGDEPVSLQQVLLLVVLLMFALIQGLLPALRRRLEELAQEAGAHERDEDGVPEAVPVPSAAAPAARPVPAQARLRARDRGVSVRPEDARARRRPRMSATDARRGIVAMVVLGRCKGWEPPLRTPGGAVHAAPAQLEP